MTVDDDDAAKREAELRRAIERELSPRAILEAIYQRSVFTRGFDVATSDPPMRAWPGGPEWP